MHVEAGDPIVRSVTHVEFTHQGRFTRRGRLTRPPGSDGREVRCACLRCGAHRYIVPQRGELGGVCVVCGGADVAPVD